MAAYDGDIANVDTMLKCDQIDVNFNGDDGNTGINCVKIGLPGKSILGD